MSLNRFHPLRAGALLTLAAFAAGCSDAAPTDPLDHAAMHGTPSLKTGGGNSVAAAGLAKAVRATAARYNATAQALKAGYAPDPACVAIPVGGMGHHWVNFGLVDPTFDPLVPEVVLYAPDADGKLKLVAVEYVVLDVGQPAPTFAGQPFDVGGAPLPVPHWTLHVWLFEENPTGMFMPWNPNVSCPAP
jgi:hypothetical protein